MSDKANRTMSFIMGYGFATAFTLALSQQDAPWYGYVMVGVGFLFAVRPWQEREP